MSFWSVLKKDFKLLLRDRPQLAVLFLMPLAFILPISFAMGPDAYGSGEDARKRLPVIDLDGGARSEQLTSVLAESVKLEYEFPREESESMVAKGWRGAALLIPGGFTFPELDTGSATVTLADGEVLTGINFGWDYQFLPVPDVDLANCTNSIEFVQDLSVPDDTVFAPGTEFEKGWQLRNNGTCPWTPDYSAVFVGGDQLGETVALSFSETIVAGQTVDVIVPMVAPEAEGTYRSNWQISNADGVPFGIDGFDSEAFWVQIAVGVPEPAPEPNSAAIGGVVWEDFCRLDAEGDPSAGCLEVEEGSGFYRADGSLNFNESRLADITVTLAAGACPEDGFLDPGAVLETTTTGADGLYRFSNLEEGVYCVAISAFSDENVNLLIPGDWTWPAQGVGLQGVTLAAGEEALEIDFGWDYQD